MQTIIQKKGIAMGISESQEAIFERLFEQAEIAAFNKKELHDYRESQKDFWDLNSVIETAEKKGRAEGQVSIAMSLKQMGVLSISQFYCPWRRIEIF